MRAKIETTYHLKPQWRELVGAVKHQNFVNLEAAERKLSDWFPNWFIYRGGSHVALHLSDGDTRLVRNSKECLEEQVQILTKRKQELIKALCLIFECQERSPDGIAPMIEHAKRILYKK